MNEETKVAEVPEVVKLETPEGEVPENRRTQIEKLVAAENETFPEAEVVEVPKESKAPEAPEAPEDPLERIKKSVQKRIDKVVAQKKSAEEELAEARAEIERLRASKAEVPAPEAKLDDKTPPTPEQVEAYIAQMSEEGNHKEVAAATRYLIKLEKEIALKEVREAEERTRSEKTSAEKKQLQDWANLSRDYVAYTSDGKIDESSDLNLSNQKGKLYTTALALYNDPELHRDFYNDPDVIQGFRRAVADAYREIHQQGLITPKGISVAPRNPRAILADPSADSAEEPTQSQAPSLSDAEKVREELKARKKNRYIR